MIWIICPKLKSYKTNSILQNKFELYLKLPKIKPRPRLKIIFRIRATTIRGIKRFITEKNQLLIDIESIDYVFITIRAYFHRMLRDAITLD